MLIASWLNLVLMYGRAYLSQCGKYGSGNMHQFNITSMSELFCLFSTSNCPCGDRKFPLFAFPVWFWYSNVCVFGPWALVQAVLANSFELKIII